MAVRVGLYDGKDARVGPEMTAEDGDIVADGREIDLGPDAVAPHGLPSRAAGQAGGPRNPFPPRVGDSRPLFPQDFYGRLVAAFNSASVGRG